MDWVGFASTWIKALHVISVIAWIAGMMYLPRLFVYHVAAEKGDVVLARTLLELGADPDIADKHYRSTPLGWARHFGQPEVAELLEPLTGRPSPD